MNCLQSGSLKVSDEPTLLEGWHDLAFCTHCGRFMSPPVSVAGAFITACMVPESFSKGFMSQYYNPQSDDIRNSILKGTV